MYIWLTVCVDVVHHISVKYTYAEWNTCYGLRSIDDLSRLVIAFFTTEAKDIFVFVLLRLATLRWMPPVCLITTGHTCVSKGGTWGRGERSG